MKKFLLKNKSPLIKYFSGAFTDRLSIRSFSIYKTTFKPFRKTTLFYYGKNNAFSRKQSHDTLEYIKEEHDQNQVKEIEEKENKDQFLREESLKMDDSVIIPPRNDEGITPRLLSELIGTKAYLYNDQITLPLDRIVACYDENDKLIGNKTLREAFNFASDHMKDVVLRSEKSDVPIVKIIRYRIELLKRLIKKYSKNVKKDEIKLFSKEAKILFLSSKISEEDYSIKVSRATELLKTNLILRICTQLKDVNSKEEIQKSNTFLMKFANELLNVGIIQTNPTVKKKKQEPGSYNIDNLSQLQERDYYEEDEFEDAKSEIIPEKVLLKEKDYNALDVVYVEIESLIVDKSGIDYDKLLNKIDLDSLSKGVKSGSFQDILDEEENYDEEEEVKTKDQRREDNIDKKKRHISEMQEKLRKLDEKVEDNRGDAYRNWELKQELLAELDSEKKLLLMKRGREFILQYSLVKYQLKSKGASEIKPMDKKDSKKKDKEDKKKSKKKKK